MQAAQVQTTTRDGTTLAESHPRIIATPHAAVTGPVDLLPTQDQAPQEEDWSFAELSRTETLWGTHGYHRYPAKFIPQLVRRIIDQYSQPGDLVADPFLGSATTGVEALRASRYFRGSDINPVAITISQAKCLPIEPATLSTAWTRLLDLLSRVSHVGRRALTEDEKQAIKNIVISHAGPSSDERFHYWFPQSHRTALDQIINAVVAVQDDAVRTFFLCAFSNILRSCSIWLSGSTKAQKDLGKKLADPSESFKAQVGDMVQRNHLYWDDLMQAGIDPPSVPERSWLEIADARSLPWDAASVDLLVTSPPYSTCYEYAELHQLTRIWFERHGLIAKDVQHAYIGSKGVSARNVAPPHAPLRDRECIPEPAPIIGSLLGDAAIARLEALKSDPAYQSKSINREVRALRYYFADMRQAIAEGARVTATGKYMVLVIGDSRKRGIDIPTSSILTEMAEAVGFLRERKIQRQIPVRILTSTRDRKTGRFSSAELSDTQVYPEEDVLVFKRTATSIMQPQLAERKGHELGAG